MDFSVFGMVRFFKWPTRASIEYFAEYPAEYPAEYLA
jgi:hypothetical protein